MDKCFLTPGYNYPIPAEEAYLDYADPTIETGKNWISNTGGSGSWNAVGTGTSYLFDLGIRAYALSTETVATPSAIPAGGTYTTIQSVTISMSTAGASIYYTTNGSTPTTSSTLYTGAIAISTSTTLKAIAVKAGMNDSAVMSEAYSIKVNTDTPTLGYNTSKKAKRKINLTFKDLTLTKKKWVKVRINGRKVAVQRVKRIENDSIVRIYLKYKKWAVGSYSIVMSYKNQTRVPYTTKKGKIKYRKGWDSGTVTSENILSII